MSAGGPVLKLPPGSYRPLKAVFCLLCLPRDVNRTLIVLKFNK